LEFDQKLVSGISSREIGISKSFGSTVGRNHSAGDETIGFTQSTLKRVVCGVERKVANKGREGLDIGVFRLDVSLVELGGLVVLLGVVFVIFVVVILIIIVSRCFPLILSSGFFFILVVIIVILTIAIGVAILLLIFVVIILRLLLLGRGFGFGILWGALLLVLLGSHNSLFFGGLVFLRRLGGNNLGWFLLSFGGSLSFGHCIVERVE